MNVHVLQHVPFEGLGSIDNWLKKQNATISYTTFYDSNFSLPKLENIDFIIILGGPMSVNDESEYPWLIAEKVFIEEAISNNKPILGICLGSQLIAASQDAAVYAGTQKEIGWLPIQSVASPDCFQFPEDITVFHWHGETYDLPESAKRLASSTACKNQAFQIGNNVIGLQFHLETTPKTAQLIIEHCGHELTEHAKQPYIQSAEAIIAAPPETYSTVNTLMEDILNYLIKG